LALRDAAFVMVSPQKFVLGTATPTRGLKYRRPTREETLRAVSSIGYKPPPEEPIQRLDVRALLAELWRD
jgi:hypothetical protein